MVNREIFTRHVERLMLNEYALRDDRRTQRALNGIIACLIVLVVLAAWWGLGGKP